MTCTHPTREFDDRLILCGECKEILGTHMKTQKLQIDRLIVSMLDTLIDLTQENIILDSDDGDEVSDGRYELAIDMLILYLESLKESRN